MGDELWCFKCDPKMKCKSMQWKTEALLRIFSHTCEPQCCDHTVIIHFEFLKVKEIPALLNCGGYLEGDRIYY
jgi:hypothetical protein